MFETLLTKSDTITQEDVEPLNHASPELTHELMQDVSSVKDLIENIEEYSDSKKLPLGKRVPYQIMADHAILNVAKAYFINDNLLSVIGWNTNGTVMSKFENGKVKYLLNDVATFLIPTEQITTVVFGSYDPDEVTIFDENEMKNTEKETIKNLSELRTNLNSLKTSGMARSLITNANIGIIKNDLNNVAKYSFSQEAFALYNQVLFTYFGEIDEILREFLKVKPENLENHYNDGYYRFKFYDNKENRQAAIDASSKLIDPIERKRNFVTEENSFTLDEIDILNRTLRSEKIYESVQNHLSLDFNWEVPVH